MIGVAVAISLAMVAIILLAPRWQDSRWVGFIDGGLFVMGILIFTILTYMGMIVLR